VESKLKEKLVKSDSLEKVKAGSKIAVAVGSRGVKNIDLITKTVITELKKKD